MEKILSTRKSHLTVGDFKKALKGIPDNVPIYTIDHDHGLYETNGLAKEVALYDQTGEEVEPCFAIEGKYIGIRL